MSKPRTFLCNNAEDNCPHYRDSAEITVGGVEKFVCPIGKTNCERDHLEPVALPPGPVEKMLKRGAIIGVPVIVVGLIWLYYSTRPAPPYRINVASTAPAARIHPGDPVSWTFAIEGGRLVDKPTISAESLSPSLITKTGLQVEKMDDTGRKYRLTAHPIADQAGRGELKISVRIADEVKATTNLAFQVAILGSPTLVLQSSQPLSLENNHDSLILPFTVSDDKIEAEKLTFTATVEPVDSVTFNIQGTGSNRSLTISRNQRESGTVKLVVRLIAPDGRETNQTYSVNVAPLPTPTLVIDVNSTSSQNTTILPGDEMTWNFTVNGGAPSEKPIVSAASLSLSVLPQDALKLEALDETNRKYKLTARPMVTQNSSVDIMISARLAGAAQNLTLSFTVAPKTPPSPPPPSIKELLGKARAAWIQEKDYPKAIGYYDDALAINAQSPEAWTGKAGVYYSWHRYAEAITMCKTFSMINPRYATAWFIKGSSEEKLGDLQEALKSYHKFLETVQPPDALISEVKDRVQKLEAH